jgi:hypothetical protein
MSKMTFTMGVMNIIVSTFLAGVAPEVLWLYTTVKILFLVPSNFYVKYKRKTHWYMVDMCWVITYISAVMGILMLIFNFVNSELN